MTTRFLQKRNQESQLLKNMDRFVNDYLSSSPGILALYLLLRDPKINLISQIRRKKNLSKYYIEYRLKEVIDKRFKN